MARNRFWAVLLGGGMLFLMVQVGLQLPALELGRAPARAATPAATPRAEKTRMPVKDLPCFGCHNIKRYEEGEKFSHTQHDKSGHCHVCHTFKPHAEVGVRKDSCVTCHEREKVDGGL